MKEEIKNPENAGYTIKTQQQTIVSVVRKIQRTKIQVSEKVNKTD